MRRVELYGLNSRIKPQLNLNHALHNIIFLVLTLLIALIFINGLAPQLQIFILGEVRITSIYFKFFLIFSLVVSILLQGKIKIPSWLLVLIFSFSAYLIIDILRLVIIENLRPSYILFGINSYYFFYLILPLVYHIRTTISNSRIIDGLWLISVPLILLGFGQWWMQIPLLPTSSNDASFFVGSWQFDQRVRAFSLFNSPLDFGQFLIFVMATSLASFLFVKRSLWSLLVFLLSIVGILTTLTRNVYIGAFCVIVTIILIFFIKNWRYVLTLPLVYGGIAFAIANNSVFFESQKGIADAKNLNIRLDQWDSYLSGLIRGGVDQIFFGNGYIQNDRFSQSQGVLIDNTYIAVVTHIGTIGLVVVLVTISSIWVSALIASYKHKDALIIGCCASISSFLAMGVFNIILGVPGLLAIIYVIASKNATKAKIEVRTLSRR